MSKKRKLIIVGVGHIGGSIGAALMAKKNNPWHIIGIEENREYREIATKRELVHEIFPVADFSQVAPDVELVVVCTPLAVLPNVVLSCSESLSQMQRNKKWNHTPVITDVGSVKTPLLTEFGGGVGPQIPFIGGHPIAGTEKCGPEAADFRLFRDHLTILTPVKKTDAKALARVKEFWEEIGARVEEMTPQEHDQALGAISHLPHMIAYGLVEAVSRLSKPTNKRKAQNLLKYAAGGFKDFTRIAGSNALMWRDIAMENQALILEAFSEFKKVMATIEESIARGDGPKLEEIFRHAEEIRKGM